MPTCIACASPYLYANATNALYSIWNTLPNASTAGAPAGSAAAVMRTFLVRNSIPPFVTPTRTLALPMSAGHLRYLR